MKQQHEKITGYRTLDDGAILLMNELKEFEKQYLEKLEEIGRYQTAVTHEYDNNEQVINGLTKPQVKETHRYLAKAKTDMQQANMWAVRAVALPQ